jgi:hypothetical protein
MYDIVYKPWTAIKAQALRDMEYWTINFDGPLHLQGEGAGILVTSPKGEFF